jgi:hypothetical protein
MRVLRATSLHITRPAQRQWVKSTAAPQTNRAAFPDRLRIHIRHAFIAAFAVRFRACQKS